MPSWIWEIVTCGERYHVFRKFTWQYVNMAKHGEKYRDKLGGEREISRRMVDEYIRKAEKIIDEGGRVAFEWPRFCTGWRSTRMWEYAIARDMWVVDFDGCMVGMRNRHGQLIKKMWRVITNDEVLAMTLSQFVCYHPPGIHARIEGQTSRDSALYSEQLTEIIATAWYGDDPAKERTAESMSSANERNEDDSSSDVSTRNAEGIPDGHATGRDRVERAEDRNPTESDDGQRKNESPGEDDRRDLRELDEMASQTESVAQGAAHTDDETISEASAMTTETVPIGASSETSSEGTILSGRMGCEDVVVEMPIKRDCRIESWDVAHSGLTISIDERLKDPVGDTVWVRTGIKVRDTGIMSVNVVGMANWLRATGARVIAHDFDHYDDTLNVPISVRSGVPIGGDRTPALRVVINKRAASARRSQPLGPRRECLRSVWDPTRDPPERGEGGDFPSHAGGNTSEL